MQTNLIISAIHFILVFVLITLGCFTIGVSFSHELRYYLSDLFLHRSEILLSIGIALILVGFFLFFGFYVLYRHKTLRLRMQSHSAQIHANVIQNSLQAYWKSHFPLLKIHTQLIFRPKNKLEIILCTSVLEEKTQSELLEQAEKDIGELLYKILGYDKEFFLTLSFL